MGDFIKGKTLHIFDGYTFQVKITHQDSNNKEKYGPYETIRVFGYEKMKHHTTEDLSRKILGRTVQCHVIERVNDELLICKCAI